MEDFIKRILIKKYELDDKRNRLDSFLNSYKSATLPSSQLDKLRYQYNTMTAYSNTLEGRLKELKPELDLNAPIQFTFSEALKFIKEFKCVMRTGWNGKGLVVFRQVPADINESIIPNMQSLPPLAKELLLSTTRSIHYASQMLILNTFTGRADSWVPSSSDVLAEDWVLVDVTNYNK